MKEKHTNQRAPREHWLQYQNIWWKKYLLHITAFNSLSPLYCK